jgi:hypothetical protein
LHGPFSQACPSGLPYFPAAQSEHALAVAEEYFPAPQFVHALAPGEEYFPAAQLAHALLMEACPSWLPYLPAAQAQQNE